MTKYISLPQFQKDQLQKAREPSKWLLVYSVSPHSDECVEFLEAKVKNKKYPFFFDSESEAKNYASWFKSDSFINLRPFKAKDLLNGMYQMS